MGISLSPPPSLPRRRSWSAGVRPASGDELIRGVSLSPPPSLPRRRSWSALRAFCTIRAFHPRRPRPSGCHATKASAQYTTSPIKSPKSARLLAVQLAESPCRHHDAASMTWFYLTLNIRAESKSRTEPNLQRTSWGLSWPFLARPAQAEIEITYVVPKEFALPSKLMKRLYESLNKFTGRNCPPPKHTHLPSARLPLAFPFSSPSFFHTIVRDGQTGPHRSRLVVSCSTCPPLSPSPLANM